MQHQKITSLTKEEIDINRIVDDKNIEHDPVALVVDNRTKIMRYIDSNESK